VLGAADFNYLGAFLFPITDPEYTTWGFASGLLTGRRNRPDQHGNLSFIAEGHTKDQIVAEFTYPGCSLTNPPHAQLLTTWGQIGARDQTWTGACQITGLLYYQGHLWHSYTPTYGGSGDQSLAFAALHDTNPGYDLFTYHGPWRVDVGNKAQGKYMCEVASAFANTYLNGHRLALAGGVQSVNENAVPFGISCFIAIEEPTTATPPDPNHPSGHATVRTKELAFFTVHNRQPVPWSVKRKIDAMRPDHGCNPADLILADTFWGPRPSHDLNYSSDIDAVVSSCWVNTAGGKQGVLFFGQLADTVEGYDPLGYGPPAGNYNGDPDHMCHVGYAALNENKCCHQQYDVTFQATGPWSASNVPSLWIYSQDDFANVATGELPPTHLRETTYARLSALPNSRIQSVATVDGRVLSGYQGAYWDATLQLLFVCQSDLDRTTTPGSPRPGVHVFSVA
jgi:hypothetical protein